MTPVLLAERLARRTPSTICLLAIEGLGSIPYRGRTALEAADCPCLDRLAGESECGLMMPVGRGITPGRATGFLALLGYDPCAIEWPAPGASPRAPHLRTLGERFKLQPTALVRDPLHRALASAAGMDVPPAGETMAEQFQALSRQWGRHDFTLIHIPDSHDGNEEARFGRQVELLEEVDRRLPALLALEPDVIAVTGDYAAPTALAGPSWHAVPFLLWSPAVLYRRGEGFTERACSSGVLGRFAALDAMPLLLGHARKLSPLGE